MIRSRVRRFGVRHRERGNGSPTRIPARRWIARLLSDFSPRRCARTGIVKLPRRARYPEFPFWPPGSEPFYTNAASERPDFFIPRCSAPNSRQLGPRSTGNRLGPLLSGHFSDTAPHVCRVFAMRASLHSPRISLPAPAAPRSSAASRRKAAGSDDLPPAGASSTWHASPAGLQFSPTAAGDW